MDLAAAGQRVAMVERGMIGGTCINVACLPTKTLVNSARLLALARRAAPFGIDLSGTPTVDIDLLHAVRHQCGGQHRDGPVCPQPSRAVLGGTPG
ncbi:hypothetical protein [Arthrobacter dokdonensis]|uniref:hypothetical protein n=1 Tax=Arthrobacter dokdonellae TaxID=2211210 RepID=UPI0014940461|nr:hypothetical protein [Arthrobacter dokdonellae]